MKTNGNENTLEPQQMILTGSKPSLLAGKRKRTAMVALSESDALKYHRDNAWPEFGSMLTMIAGEKMLAVLAGAPATQPDVFVSARDFRKTRITNYQKRTTMTGVTPLEVVSVVPDGVERKIDGVVICNRNSSAVSVSLYVTGTLTTYILDTYSIPSKAVATITPQGISVSALTRHDQLAELTDDDHTQYLLLAGRSGGQTCYGGTLTGNALVLRGNSADANGGNVDLRKILWTDNANDPAATGELARNGSGHGMARIHDGTAVRRFALLDSTTPQSGYFPRFDGTIWVPGRFRISNKISPSISADQNDWSPSSLSTSTVIRVTATGAGRNITGLSAGSDGDVIVIENIGSLFITLKNESSSSSAANRFALGSTDISLWTGDSVVLEYDSTGLGAGTGRWRCVARYVSEPQFSVYRSGAQTITAGSTTVISLETENYDTHSWFDVTTYRYTPLLPGKYLFTFNVGLASFGSGRKMDPRLYMNGSTDVALGVSVATGAAADCSGGGSKIVAMNGSTDYMQLRVTNGDVADRAITAVNHVTYLTGVRVGD